MNEKLSSIGNKLIFLDFDGVITTINSKWKLDYDKCKLIQDIIDATGAKIIVSSSWRRNTVDEMVNYLSTINHRVPFVPSWVNDIIGVTIRAYSYIKKGIHLNIPRGVEIKQWIDTHIHSNEGKEWNWKEINTDFTYVILDDDSDMLLEHKDNFIKINSSVGITEQDVKRTIEILNRI